MNMNKIGKWEGLSKIKRKLIYIKFWFMLNCFFFLPIETLFYTMYVYPNVVQTKSQGLIDLTEVWIVVFVIAHIIYNCFIFARIYELKEKISRIEYEMESRYR